jgi:hypothetical protein
MYNYYEKDGAILQILRHVALSQAKAGQADEMMMMMMMMMIDWLFPTLTPHYTLYIVQYMYHVSCHQSP